MKYFNIKFTDNHLIFINQTKLPFKIEYIKTDSYERIAKAIQRLEIRGAPAIGIAAGYGLVLSLKGYKDNFSKAFKRLSETRPTAVNLFNILNFVNDFYNSSDTNKSYSSILKIVKNLHNKDIESCKKIGFNGLKLFTKKVRILHHCNTGYLAATGQGTALSIIFTLNKHNLLKEVFVDETRPLLQGSRLTSFELDNHNIKFEIITDNMAAYIMQMGMVDAVITGADRIVKNGDTANKIGTYSLALNAKYHNIPFYIAAPETTIDHESKSGKDIRIEYRGKNEVLKYKNKDITLDRYDALNPSFDVTPSRLITAIITDKTIYRFPYKF